MKYYAVIDTNVIVSSMFKKESVPGKIVDYAIKGTIIPLLNEEIMNEYEEVLLRNEFGFDSNDVEDMLCSIKNNAIVLDRTKTDEVFIDEYDKVFYEIVLTGKKTTDSYLITGNIKHFPIKPFVVTPRQMLDIIDAHINEDM